MTWWPHTEAVAAHAMDMLHSRLGVGRKFHRRCPNWASLRTGGDSALFKTSLSPHRLLNLCKGAVDPSRWTDRDLGDTGHLFRKLELPPICRWPNSLVFAGVWLRPPPGFSGFTSTCIVWKLMSRKCVQDCGFVSFVCVYKAKAFLSIVSLNNVFFFLY